MLKVTVLQEDINKGLFRSYTHDALCIAIRRAVYTAYKPTAKFQIFIPDQDYAFINEVMFELPPEVGKFISNVDNRREVKPFSFELNVTEEIFDVA